MDLRSEALESSKGRKHRDWKNTWIRGNHGLGREVKFWNRSTFRQKTF